jgi:hypothetical protein
MMEAATAILAGRGMSEAMFPFIFSQIRRNTVAPYKTICEIEAGK